MGNEFSWNSNDAKTFARKNRDYLQSPHFQANLCCITKKSRYRYNDNQRTGTLGKLGDGAEIYKVIQFPGLNEVLYVSFKLDVA